MDDTRLDAGLCERGRCGRGAERRLRSTGLRPRSRWLFVNGERGINDRIELMRRGGRWTDETAPVTEYAVQRPLLGGSVASDAMR